MSAMILNCQDEPVPLKGMMKGASAFLCVNGPKAMAAIDKSLLYKPGITRMCVNNGAKAVRPNLWTCVDPPDRFLKSVYFDPTIMKFVPQGFCTKQLWDTELDVPHTKKLTEAPNVYQYARETGFDPEKFLTSNRVCWGLGKGQTYKKATGVRSVMLVAMRLLYELGFSKIFIVGCDFHMDPDQPYSFKEEKHTGGCRSNNNSYAGLNLMFSEVRRFFEAEGVTIYNTYANSGLRAFDHIPFEEAIEYALQPVGDPEKEITEGMYAVRKRMASKLEGLKEDRQLSGLYTPKRKLPVDKVSTMLAGVPASPLQEKETPVKQPPPKRRGKPYTVTQCWKDCDKILELFPDLQTFADKTKKRIADAEAQKRKGRRCRGCELARFSRRFYHEFITLIPSNLETILNAPFLSGYSSVVYDNKVQPFKDL